MPFATNCLGSKSIWDNFCHCRYSPLPLKKRLSGKKFSCYITITTAASAATAAAAAKKVLILFIFIDVCVCVRYNLCQHFIAEYNSITQFLMLHFWTLEKLKDAVFPRSVHHLSVVPSCLFLTLSISLIPLHQFFPTTIYSIYLPIFLSGISRAYGILDFLRLILCNTC